MQNDTPVTALIGFLMFVAIQGFPIWLLLLVALYVQNLDWLRAAFPNLFIPWWRREKLRRDITKVAEMVPRFLPYKIDRHTLRRIKQPHYRAEYLRTLLESAVEHAGLLTENIDLVVEEQEIPLRTSGTRVVGRYLQMGNKHTIHLLSDAKATAWQLIATLFHEIAHCYAQVRSLPRESAQDNEVATDMLAVCLGFGRYVRRGYMKRKRHIRERLKRREFIEKRGYLPAHEIEFCRRCIKTLV